MKKRQKNRDKIGQIKSIFKGKSSMLIVMQDHPDPDAIASAAAVRALANAIAKMQCSVVHGGVMGRAENQAMVRYMELHLHQMADVDIGQFDIIAMVDTQPKTGNNSLPDDIIPDVVIDHHPIRPATRRSPYIDVRGKYGATSTILHEYLVEAGVHIDVCLATSLLYGIRSDTQDLGRETTRADIDAFLALYPIANKRMLSRIELGHVPEQYFEMLATGLRNARVYGHSTVTDLMAIDNPDMTGEVADLLLRNEHTKWVLCYGFHEQKALLSIRTSEPTAIAGDVAKRIVGRQGTGGGHNTLAAGQIPLGTDTEREREQVRRTIVARFLRAVGGYRTRAKKLVHN